MVRSVGAVELDRVSDHSACTQDILNSLAMHTLFFLKVRITCSTIQFFGTLERDKLSLQVVVAAKLIVASQADPGPLSERSKKVGGRSQALHRGGSKPIPRLIQP